MSSLNVGHPLHSPAAGRSLRRKLQKPAAQLRISRSSLHPYNEQQSVGMQEMLCPWPALSPLLSTALSRIPMFLMQQCLLANANVLYVEGYALDRFAEVLWGLQPVHQNKLGGSGS